MRTIDEDGKEMLKFLEFIRKVNIFVTLFSLPKSELKVIKVCFFTLTKHAKLWTKIDNKMSKNSFFGPHFVYL